MRQPLAYEIIPTIPLQQGLQLNMVMSLRSFSIVTLLSFLWTFCVLDSFEHLLSTALAQAQTTSDLWKQGKVQVVTITPTEGGTGEVTDIAFLNSERFATAHANGKVRIWDLHTGRLVRTLKGDENSGGEIYSIPNSKMLITSIGKTKLWNWYTGQEIRTLEGVNSVLSPNGQVIAGIAENDDINDIRLWDSHTGQEIRTIKGGGQTNTSGSIIFSPDSQVIAGITKNNDIRLWNWHTGQEIRTIKGGSQTNTFGSISPIIFSPDGQAIALVPSFFGVSYKADKTKLWNWRTGQEIRTIDGSGLIFSPDGQLAVTNIQQDWFSTETVLFNWHTGREIYRFKGRRGTFSPDGQIVLSVDRVGNCNPQDCPRVTPERIIFFDAHTGQEFRSLKGHNNVVVLAFSPDSKAIVSSDGFWVIKIWHAPR